MKRYPCLVTLCILCCLPAARVCAQNLKAQEYGDAAYRELLWSNFGLKDYNHAAIYSGIDSRGTLREIQSTGNSVVDTDFAESTKNNGTYYGAYTLSNLTLSFENRKAIVATARQLVDAAVPYTAWNAIDPKSGSQSFTGEISDIDNIRCDGVVEYSYEKNGFRVWSSSDYPNDWSIATATGCIAHNNTPGIIIRSPDYELSPWAQRGAPDSSPNPKNTFMNRASVIKFPTYEVWQTPGADYADVSIKATDESGIHRIAVQLPGATTWTFSPRQPQDPASASYTYTVRVKTRGTLNFYARDNGGNQPSTAQTVNVELPAQKPVNPNPAAGAVRVSVTAGLSWSNGGGSASYDIYFGTANPPPFLKNQTAASYAPGPLVTNTHYYWRVDARNATGTIPGTLWSFTTQPHTTGVDSATYLRYE